MIAPAAAGRKLCPGVCSATGTTVTCRRLHPSGSRVTSASSRISAVMQEQTLRSSDLRFLTVWSLVERIN